MAGWSKEARLGWGWGSTQPRSRLRPACGGAPSALPADLPCAHHPLPQNYHVIVGDALTAEQLSDGQVLRTLNGQDLTVGPSLHFSKRVPATCCGKRACVAGAPAAAACMCMCTPACASLHPLRPRCTCRGARGRLLACHCRPLPIPSLHPPFSCSTAAVAGQHRIRRRLHSVCERRPGHGCDRRREGWRL